MSRILVDLPDSQVEALAVIVEAEHRPRAAIIRDAIEAYISQRKRTLGADVFGLWKSKKVDGLTYQQELRSEW
ncbi:MULTISPECIES: ribbon-helix-helix protein, CopG family [Burkholderiaceae]|uniref:ribbon-helix-helix protein, CopG family n=1 Tax=Burkholderiaceae TaxID=119060 RepID=UPI0009601C3E|nr:MULTISPECIES: ribbon-helix-helix protein, CopG family [Burkholderiaceae]MCG1018675.1 ribbon-helix-helix domain-containing protein [Mycetohabitans sp. B4]SIT75392.1 Ribbon-helix-helix protein, copG family [Burkholderia sp. b13]